jgi:hypothetical protein
MARAVRIRLDSCRRLPGQRLACSNAWPGHRSEGMASAFLLQDAVDQLAQVAALAQAGSFTCKPLMR